MKKHLFIIFAGLLTVACQPERQEADTSATAPETKTTQAPAQSQGSTPDQLIRPGKGIGKISVNDRAETVFATLGQPDGGDAAMGKAWSIWYSKAPNSTTDTTRYSTSVFTSRQMGVGDEANMVKQARVTSPFFRTEEGIQVGATLPQISEQFPDMKQAPNQDLEERNSIIYDDVKRGIAFEINEEQVCTAITVHPPGEEVTAIYIGMP
ncbi:hypothetical protein [Pontibacter sp. SGAir0037]|uniref:hypothetical protein n=1 Tax=Pontibacter sp. SGAir0037 TaxID=2571030 RepID=UPI0010F602F6|nr:hypothetical protein [Pontibacter sp. SGAir0037]